jgi:hypothetical protein
MEQKEKSLSIDNSEMDFSAVVEAGVKAGVAKALAEHKRMGRSIAIWRDGKVVILPPEEIPVDEITGEYYPSASTE